jgi:membrane-bound metal-dependent hydrolase YbcI (DUF457 family)
LDNLTHSLFGLTLGRTPLGRAGRGTTAALLLASNAPDIDIVTTAGGAVKYLEWHRGMTHGPLGIVGLAVVSAALVDLARRLVPKWRRPEEDATFGMLVAVSLVGVLLHVALDLPTSYGTRFLSPFSWRWFAVDWMPIIDPYLLIVLVSGVLFSRPTAKFPGARRRNALIVLTLMAVNYGLRGYAHHEALVLAPRLFGPTLPAPCDPPSGNVTLLDSWPKPPPSPAPEGHRCLVEIAAVPTFISPFEWQVIARMSNAYEIHDLNVLDARLRAEDSSAVFWRRVLRYPNIWTPAIEQAAVTRVGRVFLGFSRFPAARSVAAADGNAIVRFSDVRFAASPLTIDQPARRVQPFTATIRFDRSGRLLAESLGLR